MENQLKVKQNAKIPIQKIDFVKRNIENIRKKSLKNASIKSKKGTVNGQKTTNLKSNSIHKRKPLQNKCFNGQPVRCEQNVNEFEKKCIAVKKSSTFKKRESIKNQPSCKNIPKVGSNKVHGNENKISTMKKYANHTQSLTPSQKMRKKLVRRSVCKLNSSAKKSLSTLSMRASTNRRISSCKTPLKTSRKQTEIQEKLNKWLISKGKEPKSITGFKPAKTIVTPVNSPKHEQMSSKSTSQWQSLRDEESCDEIAVLLKQMHKEVESCIKQKVGYDKVTEILKNLAENHSAVKTHSKYWIMIMQVCAKFGKSNEDIVNTFEEAVKCNAQPILELQEGLKDCLLQQIKDTKDEDSPTQKVASEKDENYSFNKENMNKNSRNESSPVIKNASTSPFAFPQKQIVFKTPMKHGISPLVLESSPSSVVKLRVINQSSPIFKKLLTKRMLPSDTTAIVTPVRRSQRIASTHTPYPATLQERDSCLSSMKDIFSVMQSDTKHTNSECDIAFQPNKALGTESDKVCMALQF